MYYNSRFIAPQTFEAEAAGPRSFSSNGLANALNGARLPQFVRDLLAAPPRHGDGVHNWLFRVARVLHPFRSEAEISAILHAAVHACGRHVPESEVTNAIQNSKGVAWQPQAIWRPRKQAPRWPLVSSKQREAAIASAGMGLVDLWENSPVTVHGRACGTEMFIDALFPGNPWLCVGQSARKFRTRLRQDLRGEMSAASLIVPSTMTAQEGRTKDGRASEHTLENTGPRRFLVVEFDSGHSDEHAALLAHMAQHAPLALAVHSGGKSLHGWFFCEGQPEERVLRLFRHAVRLGADPATWTRSQFVRMPDGRRDNGARQTVYYFNPAVCSPVK